MRSFKISTVLLSSIPSLPPRKVAGKHMGRDYKDEEVRPNGKDRSKRHKKEKHHRERSKSPENSTKDRSNRKRDRVSRSSFYHVTSRMNLDKRVSTVKESRQKRNWVSVVFNLRHSALDRELPRFSLLLMQGRSLNEESNHIDSRRDKRRSSERYLFT